MVSEKTQARISLPFGLRKGAAPSKRSLAHGTWEVKGADCFQLLGLFLKQPSGKSYFHCFISTSEPYLGYAGGAFALHPAKVHPLWPATPTARLARHIDRAAQAPPAGCCCPCRRRAKPIRCEPGQGCNEGVGGEKDSGCVCVCKSARVVCVCVCVRVCVSVSVSASQSLCLYLPVSLSLCVSVSSSLSLPLSLFLSMCLCQCLCLCLCPCPCLCVRQCLCVGVGVCWPLQNGNLRIKTCCVVGEDEARIGMDMSLLMQSWLTSWARRQAGPLRRNVLIGLKAFNAKRVWCMPTLSRELAFERSWPCCCPVHLAA